MKEVKIMIREEKCIILDFLPSGYPGRRHAEAVAQAMGRNFTLLEVVPKEGVTLKPEEEVYIGEGPRDKIRFIKSQLEYSRLTNFAKSLIPKMVENIVKEEESKFVNFFNTAGTITPRMHQIELLPGIGKKHIMDLLDERRKKPFESFSDIFQRVRLFPDPVKSIIKRILQEIENDEKYYLFVPPKRKPMLA
jgi:putative nucleotide binding protein